jgi:1,2-dihydroxy-3-keto-5-methylthiopentene dioxygenase
MKVYYHDESNEHPTAAHDTTGEYLGLEDLKQIGVLGFSGFNLDQVNAIAKERGYVARDEVHISASFCAPVPWSERFRLDRST